jgi:hypothetical protein
MKINKMVWPDKIVVEAREDNMGNIYVRPISDKWAMAFAEHVEEFTGHKDLEAFFQDGGPAIDFLENSIPKRLHSELGKGYAVRWKEDPWIVAHWYGYDAHAAIEASP